MTFTENEILIYLLLGITVILILFFAIRYKLKTKPIPIEEPDEEEKDIDYGAIFTLPDTMPIFPGCEKRKSKKRRKACTEKALLKAIYADLKYPSIAKENGIEGLVVISLVVDQKGKITDIEIILDLGYECGDEVVRVVNTLHTKFGHWTPGKKGTQNVRVKYNVPIRFVKNLF